MQNNRLKNPEEKKSVPGERLDSRKSEVNLPREEDPIIEKKEDISNQQAEDFRGLEDGLEDGLVTDAGSNEKSLRAENMAGLDQESRTSISKRSVIDGVGKATLRALAGVQKYLIEFFKTKIENKRKK